jgi:hypothetical protein
MSTQHIDCTCTTIEICSRDFFKFNSSPGGPDTTLSPRSLASERIMQEEAHGSLLTTTATLDNMDDMEEVALAMNQWMVALWMSMWMALWMALVMDLAKALLMELARGLVMFLIISLALKLWMILTTVLTIVLTMDLTMDLSSQLEQYLQRLDK